MQHQRKISVTGLGYVGLTIAAALGKTQRVIGYDKSEARIAELKKGYDRNAEVEAEKIKQADIHYTTNPDILKEADFHIIAVLTPINSANMPDLSILLSASESVGKNLKKGDIVVYEPTVYPGATEEKCIPTLEKASGLKCGKDFNVGYSPERINPADKEHTFENIIKIISATTPESLDVVAKVYESVIPAGVFRASSLRVAEAAKVIENTQRDVNIAVINEITLILHSLGMDISEVLAATKTKWNFLPFYPGLVGGHCIGVNSYYLTNKAEEMGFHPEVILAGRRVNNYMSKFIAKKTIKKLIHLGTQIKNARIAVLGLTYKENYPDLSDSRVTDVIRELKTYETNVLVHDPIVDPALAKKIGGFDLTAWKDLNNLDAIILAVAHKEFMSVDKKEFKKMLKPNGVLVDVNRVLDPKEFAAMGVEFWRL